ncbi:MAG TPA: serine/threonine-protein kinase [Polyangia bacterium]|nr:serine/threonine-protein kinase [Polyangia bacterium]
MDASPPEPPDPRVGAVLQGRYRLDAQLASGAMGIVYRGERLQLGRPVAVKFLHPWIATQRAFLDRFQNEARAMSRLQHPNCVSVIDFGVDGAPYLVMDFITGKTLRDTIAGGRLEPARALRLVRQLLAGLGYAHAQGIIHRDLKPENLILSDEPGLSDHLRILDFGLAKLRDGPAMTAGLAVGTPSYMSPEQTGADGAIDARTDLYAVGIVLFELLAGRKPFQSENVGELLLMHRDQPPPLLRASAPDVGLSAEIEAVVSKALSKFADDRYQSAAEFSAALDATPEGGAARPGAGRAAPVRPVVTAAFFRAAPMGAPPAQAPGGAAALQPPGAAPAASPPPSDATIVDSASRIQRLVGEAAAPAAAPRDRRAVWGGIGLGALAVAALLVGRAVRTNAGSKVDARRADGASASVKAQRAAAAPAKTTAESSAAPAAAPATESPRPSASAIAEQLAEARRLLARGDWEQARATLETLRAGAPDDADAAYLLATIDLEHRRWAEGLAAAQVAARRNPALKSDPDLVKDVIQALASDPSAERAQSFLRGAGAPAKPFLKEAARRDPNLKVRDRAAELLAGDNRSPFRWSSRSSSPSSRSVFHR